MDESENLSIPQVQQILFELLVVFDSVCEKHAIRYSLGYGTLLGAVRHKGFIPWDDDVDVMVPRPDYDRLLRHPEWWPEHMRLDSWNTREDYILPFAKLVDTRWRAQEPVFNGIMEEYLWIDIFPVDGVPENDFKERVLRRRLRKLCRRGMHSCRHAKHFTIEYNNIFSNRVLVRTIAVLQPILQSLLPNRKLFRKMDKLARKCQFGETRRATNILWGYNKPIWTPPEDFDALVCLEFERSSFKAVPSWDDLLTQIYGDYMELPPVDQRRGKHRTKVWRA